MPHPEKQYLHLVKNIIRNGIKEVGRNGTTYTKIGAMMRFPLTDKQIPLFMEGISNTGPKFNPTCKMIKHKYSSYATCNQSKIKNNTSKQERLNCQYKTGYFRNNIILNYTNKQCYKLGKIKQRAPSWCDRILYRNAICKEYRSYDFSQIMAMSDHTAIYGSYIIT